MCEMPGTSNEPFPCAGPKPLLVPFWYGAGNEGWVVDGGRWLYTSAPELDPCAPPRREPPWTCE